jgi:hypothetical protein
MAGREKCSRGGMVERHLREDENVDNLMKQRDYAETS